VNLSDVVAASERVSRRAALAKSPAERCGASTRQVAIATVPSCAAGPRRGRHRRSTAPSAPAAEPSLTIRDVDAAVGALEAAGGSGPEPGGGDLLELLDGRRREGSRAGATGESGKARRRPDG
jgi:hypothetical protein